MPIAEPLPLLPLVLDGVPDALCTALMQEGIPCVDICHAHRGRFVLFDSRHGEPRCGRGQQAIDVDHLRRMSDGDPLGELADRGAATCTWRIRGYDATEEVAQYDKRAARARVMRWLRRKIEDGGGVWIRLSAYPFPYKSALNLRIDHDEFDAGDYERLLEAIGGHERATSHYVCADPFLARTEVLARLAGMHVGAHGFRHHTYLDADQNATNIRRGIEFLREAGLDPVGFAAPHGRFNDGLLAALDELRVGHSSEFALAYDELPFFPGQHNVLQIPVHPVSLGIVLEAAGHPAADGLDRDVHPADAFAEYLGRYAVVRYRAGEPVFVYGHPTGRLGRFPGVVRALWQAIEPLGALWQTSLAEFAAWWRARSTARLSVVRDRDAFAIWVSQRPRGYRLAAEFWRGEHAALVPLDDEPTRLVPGALAFARRSSEELPRPVRIDRPQGIKARLRRILDWERVTPRSELSTATWRGVVKRTLRRDR